jgi:ATP-dependent Clp protease ATP-binding subunit ClpC
MVARIDERLKDRDMGLAVTPAARQWLADKGWEPELGARPLRRTVQREIEDGLSERILHGELRPGQLVLVDQVDGELEFRGVDPGDPPDPAEWPPCRDVPVAQD